MAFSKDLVYLPWIARRDQRFPIHKFNIVIPAFWIGCPHSTGKSPMHPHRRSIVVAALMTIGAARLGAQGPGTDAKPVPLDQPPVLNRVFPPALSLGNSAKLELRGIGVETTQDILASRQGLAFTVIPPEPLPPAPKPGTRPMPQPMNQPSRLVGRVEATVPSNLAEGIMELRVVTPGGVSNPRRVLLTNRAVLEEKEPNDSPENGQLLGTEAVAAGVISATTDVDYFRFQGKKGQRVLARLATSSLESRLPGALEIIGPDNRVLAQARDRVDADTLLDLRLPVDGEFTVRVFSFGHVEGGPDAFYLLRLAAGPEVESVHPLVQSPGGGECLVFGHGLPGGTQVAGRRDGLEQARLTLKPVGEEAEPLGGLAGGLLPLRPFRFDGGPVIRLPVSDTVWVEGQEPADNNSADKAIPLTLPTVVAARLEKPGDRDFFSFEGKKGEPVWLELLGDRVGTRLDFVFTLKEAGETASREIDDGPEPLHNPWFFNRTEDPAILFTPPRDGVYQVGVSARDVNLGGAPHQVYALRVGPPRPDFRLVTIDPATQAGMPRLKPGTALSILVLADRTGGLNAPIEVVPEGLPPGVQALPCVIPSGQKGAWLTLVGGEGMTEAVWTLNLIGICQPSKDGEILKRSARHASPAYPSAQQINNPQPGHMVDGLFVATSPRPPALRLKTETKSVKLIQGERATVRFTLAKPEGMTGQGQVTLMEAQNQQEAPVRVSNGNNGQVAVPANASEAEFTLEARNTGKAQVTHLVPRFTITTQEDDPDNRGRRRPVIRKENGPPIEVTLLPRRPLQPTLTSQTIRAKPGEKGTLTLKLNRQGFHGSVRLACPEYKLDTTVAAETEEAPLELTLPENARAGAKSLVIQATCEALPGHPVEQEIRLQFNLATPAPRAR